MQTLQGNGYRIDKSHWIMRMAICATIACIVSSPLSANTFALPDGQANIPRQFEHINLDLAGRANADDERYGARIAFPAYSGHFVLFLEAQRTQATLSGIALGNEVDVSGRSAGGGIYITGLAPWRNYTPTLRLSGQSDELDVDSNIVVSGIQAQTTLRNRSVSLALILSPLSAQFANGTNVYMTLGASYQRTRRTVRLNDQEQQALYRYEQDYLPQLAIGIVYPYKRISLFASIGYEQDLAAGLGVRLPLTRNPGE